MALSLENARLLDAERKARGKAELAAWALREKVEELETSQTLFRAAFESARGMAVLSPSWEVLRANAALLDLLGYEEHELLQSPFLSLVHVADERALREDAGKVRAGAATCRVVRLLRRDGSEVRAEVSATLAKDHAGRPHAVILHVQPDGPSPASPAPERTAGVEELRDIGRILSNPTNVTLLRLLLARPSYARAIAKELGRSERDIQRKLHAMERAGLVAGAWRQHEGATVKVYQATAGTLHLSFLQGGGDGAGSGPTGGGPTEGR